MKVKGAEEALNTDSRRTISRILSKKLKKRPLPVFKNHQTQRQFMFRVLTNSKIKEVTKHTLLFIRKVLGIFRSLDLKEHPGPDF